MAYLDCLASELLGSASVYHMIYQHGLLMLAIIPRFSNKCWDISAGPPVCAVDTLLAEPFPKPYIHSLNKSFKENKTCCICYFDPLNSHRYKDGRGWS